MSTQWSAGVLTASVTAKPTIGTRMAAVRTAPPAMATPLRKRVRVTKSGSSSWECSDDGIDRPGTSVLALRLPVLGVVPLAICHLVQPPRAIRMTTSRRNGDSTRPPTSDMPQLTGQVSRRTGRLDSDPIPRAISRLSLVRVRTPTSCRRRPRSSDQRDHNRSEPAGFGRLPPYAASFGHVPRRGGVTLPDQGSGGVMPNSVQRSSTRRRISGDITIASGHGRTGPSPGHLRVASKPILDP